MSSDVASPHPVDLAAVDRRLAAFSASSDRSVDAFRQDLETLLAEVGGQPELLSALLLRCQSDPDLARLCERDQDAVKLVLWTCPETKAALRLHRFLGSGPDRPHSHRWPFVAHILRGAYRHTLYALEGPLRPGVALSDLTTVMDRMETAGTIYGLGPDIVHAVDAPNDTLSLVYRAPAVVDRLLVVDQSAGDTYWHYGSSQPEASDNRYTRALTQEGRQAEIERALDLLDLGPYAGRARQAISAQ